MWLLVIPLGVALCGLVLLASYWADGIVQAHREQRDRNSPEGFDRT